MSGDPCICGDTETWHPECYQRQREEAAADALAKARAEGRVDGLREAAGIAKGKAEIWAAKANKQEGLAKLISAEAADAVMMVANAILAAVPSPVPDRATERCEWKFREYGDGVKWFGTGCGCLERGTTGPYCQCCGRKISLVPELTGGERGRRDIP